MSALQHINSIQRPKPNANLEDARRRRCGRLDFLRRGRTNIGAAVVRLQPPLPAGSLALPPSDDIQSRQWATFSPSRLRELSNNLPATSELGSYDSTRPELDTFRSRTELDAFRPSAELDASRALYQLDGGQVSIHDQSPISTVSQTTTASRLQESIHIGNGSHDGMILELDALNQRLHQHDGEYLVRVPVGVSPIKSLAHGTTTPGSVYPHASIIDRTHNRPASVSLVAPLRPLGVKARTDGISTTGINLDGPVGFDCPIRAGPNGANLCTWPSSSKIRGFPKLARVKEHVGSHGLPCPDCGKVFTIPTRYRDHRTQKTQTGICSDVGSENSKISKHLDLSPEVILKYFERTGKGISEHDAWLNGYKVLHQDWEYEESLPSPFYTGNVAHKQLPLVQEMPCNGQGSTSQPFMSSKSQVVASVSTGQSTHYNTRALTKDGADPNFDLANQQLNHNVPDDLDFTHLLDDLTWVNAPSGEPQLTDNAMEYMFTMSGALPDPVQASDTTNSSQMSQIVNASDSTVWDFPVDAAMVVGDQIHNADADAVDLTKQLSLDMSMLNNEGTSVPCWQTRSRVVDDIGSAMKLCDTPNVPAPGADNSFLNHLPQSFMARGIAKPPVRPARVYTPALQNALNRTEKLAAQVEKFVVQQAERRAKVKGTKSENSSLRRRIEEVESEKDYLLDTLVEIGNQVDAWHLEDGEALDIDSLSDRMQKIKLLLPH